MFIDVALLAYLLMFLFCECSVASIAYIVKKVCLLFYVQAALYSYGIVAHIYVSSPEYPVAIHAGN
jgi:hypothetical protein